MRFSRRIRWWWIAETMSSEGIGVRSLFESRSDRMMNSAPFSIASSTSAHISVRRSASESGPESKWYRPRTVTLDRSGRALSMWRIFASSSLSITGKSSDTVRVCSGPHESRLLSDRDRA